MTDTMNDVVTDTDTTISLQTPNLWNVKILNDDFTPIDFVIAILMGVFKKSEVEALEMTLKVHEEGSAIVGTYTKDIAVTKCIKVAKIAESEGHPLRTVPEPSV